MPRGLDPSPLGRRSGLCPRVWSIRDGTTFECADSSHQTSLPSGMVLEKTRKPLNIWFRAIFEISTRRTGISGKDLQRSMGFSQRQPELKGQACV